MVEFSGSRLFFFRFPPFEEFSAKLCNRGLGTGYGANGPSLSSVLYDARIFRNLFHASISTPKIPKLESNRVHDLLKLLEIKIVGSQGLLPSTAPRFPFLR